jgi:hypothetical protein
MSYYIYCENVEVCLENHEYYHSKEEVFEQIKENEGIVNNCKQKIIGLSCGNPKELLDVPEGVSIIDTVQEYIDKLFETIEYCYSHNVDLQYIADNWDKHKEG